MQPNKLHLAVLAAGLIGAINAHANLIINGDFETPALGHVNPNDLAPGSSALTGWTIGGTGGVTVNHVGSGFSYWTGNSSQWLDLTGSSGGAWIQQSFATTAGKTYNVTFDTFNGSYSYNDGYGIKPTGFSVQATGGSLMNVTSPAATTLINYSFTASSASSTLRFTEITGVDSNAGWIDNVRVSAVPEPSTVIAGAMLLLPFGVSALRNLRKRQ